MSDQSSEANKDVRAHLYFLDTIRGLAALTVIASHYVLTYGLPCKSEWCDQILTNSPLHIWWDGYAAVSMFFVLSGLVLSLKHFRTTCHPAQLQLNLLDYSVVRFFRIWGPYVVVLLVSVWLQKNLKTLYDITPLPQGDWIKGFWKDPITPVGIIKEMVLGGPYTLNILPQAWTLSIELVISLIMPIGILLAHWSTRGLIFFMVFVLLQPGSSLFIFHFTLGLLIAKYFSYIPGWLESRKGLRQGCLFASLFLYTFRFTVPVYLSEWFKWDISDPWIWSFTGVGSAGLLMWVLSSIRAQHVLSKSWLVGLGKISYSLYLIHFAVLLCVTPAFLTLFNSVQTFSFGVWLAGFGATVGATLLLAIPCYRYIEIQSVQIGKWVSQKAQSVMR